MHDDALARRQVAEDVVARHGIAAIAETEHAAFGAGDEDFFRRAQFGLRMRRGAVRFGELSGDLIGHAVAERDVGEQFFEAFVARVAQESVERGGRDRVEAQAARIECAIEHAMAEFDGVFVLQALEEVADRRARTRGHHPLQPLRIAAVPTVR